MYKLFTSINGNKFVIRLSDNAFISMSEDNTDYQTFKSNIANGAELQDADGNPITGDALTTFIATLP